MVLSKYLIVFLSGSNLGAIRDIEIPHNFVWGCIPELSRLYRTVLIIAIVVGAEDHYGVERLKRRKQ